jgi:hypothetical protein
MQDSAEGEGFVYQNKTDPKSKWTIKDESLIFGVKFIHEHLHAEKPEAILLQSRFVFNDSPVEQEFNVQFAEETSNSSKFSITKGLNFDASISLESGIPSFAKGRLKVGAEIIRSTTNEQNVSQKITISNSATVRGPSYSITIASIWLTKTKYEIPWKGKNGSKDVGGILRGVTFDNGDGGVFVQY